MKKHLLVVALFSAAIFSNAQSIQETAVIEDRLLIPASNNLIEQPVSTPSAVAAANPIWQDNFSDLSNWTVGSTGATGTTAANWQYTTTGPSGALTGGLGPVVSPTAGNGWVIFDAEANGSLDAQGGSTGVVFDSYIQMANPINLSSHPSVAVTFTEYYYELNAAVYLEVSTNGSTWNTIQLHPSLNSNQQTANDAVQYVDISATAGGASSVWVRLRYEGGGVFWQVDDFQIVEGVSDDLAIEELYHGDIFAGYEYSAIPTSQAQEVTIAVIAGNVGSSDMTGVTYTYDISNAGGTVSSGSFPATNTTLSSGDLDTTVYATGFIPSVVDEYTVTVSVAGDNTDAQPSDNSGSSTFLLTNDIYAHDETLTGLMNGGTQNDPAPEYLAGLIYEVVADVTLSAIQTIFYTQTGFELTSSTAWYEVYELVPGSQTPISQLTPIASGLYDLQPGDVSSGANVTPIDIELNGGLGVQLTAGNSYVVSLGNADIGETLVMLTSPGDDDFAGLRYGPYGQGGAVDWYTGWTSTPAVRAKLSTITVDVAENEEVSKFNVYPNPTVQDLTVELTSVEDADMTINIISSTGALVASEQLTSMAGQKSRVNFNVDNLASGIYTVQIQGLASTLTKRVVVK